MLTEDSKADRESSDEKISCSWRDYARIATATRTLTAWPKAFTATGNAREGCAVSTVLTHWI
jgi:hypothetical protein